MLGVLCAVLSLFPAYAQSRDLEAALRATPPGGILELPAGDWGALRLRGPDGPSIIRSADPSNPARISRMEIREAGDLTLQDLTLKYDWSAEDLIRVSPFEIIKSENIRLDSVHIVGDVARGDDPVARGLPWGIGLSIQYSHDVTVENSEVTAFYRGIVVRGADRTEILGNDIHGLRMDGLNFAMVRGVRIEGNHIYDFDRSTDVRDHADMIQFWTNQTDYPSTGITIRGNLLNSGNGVYTQSIFMRNDLVDRGLAGREMFYKDILIEGNFILNAHLHGITVGETDGLTIRSNTLVHNPTGAGADPTRDMWLPQIRVSEASRNVTIKNNIAAAFPAPHAGWKMANNLVVQPHAIMGTNHYSRIFAGFPGGDPTKPASYRIKTGSLGDQPNLGARY